MDLAFLLFMVAFIVGVVTLTKGSNSLNKQRCDEHGEIHEWIGRKYRY